MCQREDILVEMNLSGGLFKMIFFLVECLKTGHKLL